MRILASWALLTTPYRLPLTYLLSTPCLMDLVKLLSLIRWTERQQISIGSLWWQEMEVNIICLDVIHMQLYTELQAVPIASSYNSP
jgi:hypothetical protein